MRIQRRPVPPEQADRLWSDIDQAARGASLKGRVCDGCTAVCAVCGSAACACACSPHCPDAAVRLSCDPDFPIEPGILGLVFAMARSGLFTPCWSCEGHPAPRGGIWRLPGVWFYCDATVHVRLLADVVDRLANIRRLNAHWTVAVTFSDPDNPRTTFALQPVAAPDQTLTLEQLQADATTIALALPEFMAAEARALQRAARPALAPERAESPI